MTTRSPATQAIDPAMKRPAGFGVLVHQTLEGDRDLMDGIGWRSGSMTKVHDRT